MPKTKRLKKRTKTQQLWKMRGCSLRKKNKRTSKQLKGGCAACFQKGGSSALIGKSWTPNTSTWGKTNYYPENKYPVDLQTNYTSSERTTSQKGGKNKKQKGGGIPIPQFVSTLGNNIAYGLGSVYNGFSGFPPPVNPNPTQGQLINTPSSASLGYSK